MKENKRILYCVLNWGLGHATRSIPVIRALKGEGYVVDIASDGGPLKFLEKTFPECRFYELPGYDISYPTRSVLLNAISQYRNMRGAVRQEKIEIDQLISHQSYDAIVSDNRYGCHHTSVTSILITHQLSNLAHTTLLSKSADLLIKNYLKQFTEIWVPDTPDRMLSGRLTDVEMKNMRFVGHLSDQISDPQPIEYDIAAILSGPEPQRTKLEQEILPQLKSYPGKCVLVRGVIDDEAPKQDGNVTIHSYRTRAEINDLLNSSKVIVCRTGYSSLMDLLQVGVKAILIPTPGQPEQEYLGKRMKESAQFVVQRQRRVNVVEGVQELNERPVPIPASKESHLLNNAIAQLKPK